MVLGEGMDGCGRDCRKGLHFQGVVGFLDPKAERDQKLPVRVWRVWTLNFPPLHNFATATY